MAVVLGVLPEYCGLGNGGVDRHLGSLCVLGARICLGAEAGCVSLGTGTFANQPDEGRGS